MKDLIKQILRESNNMFNIHDKDSSDYKLIDSVNNLYFQKLESQGLGLYILTRDDRYIMYFNKVNSRSELKKYENKSFRIDGFVMNENTSEKIKKAVDNMNEIVELKYNSIKLLNQHLIASISEAIKKQK
jgi:hypothetical protein